MSQTKYDLKPQVVCFKLSRLMADWNQQKKKKKYSRYLNILNYLWKTLIIRVLLSYK